jgi:hypothetical protein
MGSAAIIDPVVKAKWDRSRVIEAEVSDVAGVLNAAHGQLVLHVAELLTDPALGLGDLASAAQWLAWKAGLSPAHATDVQRLAERNQELPCTVAALCAGRLSLDQAAVIARHVPAEYEESACETAQFMTVRQLRRTLSKYAYDADKKKTPEPAQRSVSTGTDERGWWGRFRLSVEEGAVVDQALRSVTDDLRRQAKADTAEGEKPAPVTMADGLLAVAEAALRAGEARFPGSERYLVNIHLEGSADDEDPCHATLHMGAALPRHIRRRLTCDPRFRSLLHRGRTTIGAGRITREISRKLRTAIEHRDGGCAVPTCGARAHLEIHHIVHWEDGGFTETWNLVALCWRHHHMHHDQLLGITGNPDLEPGTPGALEFTDAFDRPITCGATPTPPPPEVELAQAAEAAGAQPEAPYAAPYNEPLRWLDFHLKRSTPPPETTPGNGAADGNAP